MMRLAWNACDVPQSRQGKGVEAGTRERHVQGAMVCPCRVEAMYQGRGVYRAQLDGYPVPLTPFGLVAGKTRYQMVFYQSEL